MTELSSTQNLAVSRKTLVRAFVGVVLLIFLGEYFSLGYTLVFPAEPLVATHFHTTNLAWVFTIVALANVPLCPLAGKIADRFGSKNVILVLAAIFVIGSLICALTSSYGLFIFGRGLEGVGIVLTAVQYAYVRTTLPKRWVPLGLGVIVTGLGASGILGPFLANWLIDSWGLHGIFWFLTIYAAALGVAFAAFAPDSGIRLPSGRLDFISGIVLGGGLGCILVGIGFGENWGWSSASVVGYLVGGIVLVALSCWRMMVVDQPLLDLRKLAGPQLRWTLLFYLLLALPANGYAFLAPFMIETPRLPGLGYGFGASFLHYAVYLLPFGIASIVCGPLGGHLCRSRNPRLVALLGAFFQLAGMLMWAFMHTQSWMILLDFGVFGIGFGFLFAAVPNLIAQAVPVTEMGVAAGVMQTTANISAGTAPVVLSAILAANVYKFFPATGTAVYTNTGLVICYVVLAGAALAGLVILLPTRFGRRPGTMEDREEVLALASTGEAVVQ